MDSEYEEGVLSILRRRKGWYDEFSSISEFKQELEEADLAQQKLGDGWVLWKESERHLEQQQIITLLQNIPSILRDWSERHYLLQFWGAVKVERENHHYLSTTHHPFSVSKLSKGHCWYRKLCRDHVYVVDVDDDDEEQVGLGGVGRAYKKKQPESSPDLRIYTTNEFPMRDEAARCGFSGYLALPLFDFHTDQCYGVLELLSDDTVMRRHLLSPLDGALQIAGFRSNHNSISISDIETKMPPESEITDILELVMITVPRLYLALVWIPCKQCCVNMMNTNLRCMEITSFITSQNKMVNSRHDIDVEMNEYLEACGFHNLQTDLSSLHSNLSEHVSISKNPLAHYAHKAMISHSFAVSLINMYSSNHLYVIQFFHQDAYGDYCLHLLSRIMEMNLKSFKFVPGGRLVSESRKPNAIECESTERLNEMKSYKQKLSQSNFITYLEMDDSCCLRPSPEDSRQGWVFGINGNSLLVPVLIKEKIENFMNNIQVYEAIDYWIIQFWAPKMVEDRCCLAALDQPYAVGSLAKGLASFRKKCMMHFYFVDDEAKEEELGPPGRVFRNGHHEISPDLFHYTTNEYPIRNYAIHCCSLFSRGYFALPIFDDEHDHKCVGVLEFVGFFHSDLENIGRELEAAKLCSTHTVIYPIFLANELDVKIICREEAPTELRNVIELICNIPQLHKANVWVSNKICASNKSNMSCMQLALSTGPHAGRFRPIYQVQWIHVHTRKGIVGMVLASENKSCFCQNLCEFSIIDQPLSHFEMSERREVCFAICLQSSHTGDLVYVVEFYLYKGPTTYEYLRSFLNVLLPIMKHELKSFKMAYGEELGEELVVDVIKFSNANKVDSSEPEEADVFPIKFKSVHYSQKEHQHSEEQQAEECNVVVDHQHSEEQQAEECSVAVEHQHSEAQQIEECSVVVERQHNEEQQTEICSVAVEQHTEEEQQIEVCNVAASGSKTKERGKRKTGLSLSLEVLKSHFGKKLEDAAEELGIGKSTIKRACRGYGIDRWPTKENYKKNPSLFVRKSGRVYQQDTNSESTHHVNAEEAEKVMIKVKYEEDIIKFELCLSLGLAKLIEEVSTRLNLEKGAFKLKYLDEDGDDILLTNDADLQLCQKTQIAMNKTHIQLFVR